jgi:hypothetical protein
MKLNIRGIATFIPPDGSSHEPGWRLECAVHRVIDSVLLPLRIRGLSEIAPTVITPGPKRAPPVGILGLRVVGGRASCRFMLSPPVPSASPKWPAYRVAFVEELTGLWLDLLRALEERLERADTPFDLEPARRAIERECRKLARRVTTSEAPAPNSTAWLAESKKRIRLPPAKATARVTKTAARPAATARPKRKP